MGLVSGLLQRCGCKKRQSSHELQNPVSEQPVAGEQSEQGGRAQWGSATEFLLTCIGYSVGLGNVWRFPYLCYKSGGGAFLIPYFIFIVLIGMPLLFMEYSFGQYFGVGGLSIFKRVCPLFQGIGIGYVVLNALVCIYYNVIIGLSLYYMFASFTSVLPWGTCGNWWNTKYCGDPVAPVNTTCANLTSAINETMFSTLNDTDCIFNSTLNDTKRTSPSEEYWKHYLLDVKPEHSIDNIGGIRWHMCLCLLLAWIFVILFVCKGIKSTGKVVYFTATFPYVMLTVLVVRGVTLPGATTGILYFVTPNFTALANPEVWFGAATQLFYSTNLAWGGMITMASYNDFKHNCYRDAVVINFVSFFTSLYAGFAVFSVIGYMANEYGQKVEDVIDSGPGLAFIVYPRALGLMPLAPMWSFLFFFMLFLLGIGSQIVLIETVVTGFVDEFPVLGKNACVRLMTTVSFSVLACLLGLPQVTQGGMYVLQLMDWYSAGFCVMVIAIFEAIGINWLYGNLRFVKNVKEMLGSFPCPAMWWRICWMVISPAIIFAVLLFKFVDYKRATYGAYKYPMWADMLGWVMSLASVLPIFAVAIYKYIRADGSTFTEKWRRVIRPTTDDRGSAIEVDTKDVDKPSQIDKVVTGVKDEDNAQHTALLKQEEAERDSHI